MASWAEMAAARPGLEARARVLYLIEQPDAPGPADRAMHKARVGGLSYSVWRAED